VARHFNALALAALTVLVVAAAAGAQSPAADVYGGEAGNVQGQVGGVAAGGTLPFTGASLAFIVAAGVALLLTGILLARGRRAES
jgi:hypothetical protein